METLFEFSIYAGLLLIAIAAAWLIFTAFRVGTKRGLAVMAFFPVAAPWHIYRDPARTAVPAAVLALGIALTSFPPLYTRLAPIDLGPRIREVDGETHITLTGWDRGDYRAIAQHPDAVVLQMANADVDDSVLEHVRGLARLRELDLDNTRMTDVGLALVADLPELQRLRISNTPTTDAGFRATLMAHPKLRRLWCPGTGIWKSTLEEWKQSGEGRRAVGGVDGPLADSTTGTTTDASTESAETAGEGRNGAGIER
ncbi:MAG: hypothetical protein KF774_14005 [Planctomyces sp.]|nr:hypothetical protein [Planctomyces sp.]